MLITLMNVDDIRNLGDEEYIIMNLDSRQMDYDGQTWNVKNTKGQLGLDEPIPYVTSIELVDSYIPNTFYNIEEYNNVFEFGTELERYVLNSSSSSSDDDTPSTSTSTYNVDDENGFKEIPKNGDLSLSVTERPYVKFHKNGEKLKKSSFFVKQSNVEKITHTYDGVTADIGHKITLSRNDADANRNVDNAHDTLPMHVVLSRSDGTIIKRGDIDGFEIIVLNGRKAHAAFGVKTGGKYDASNISGWFDDESDPSSPRVVGDLFDEDVDDIPENTKLRVFTKKTLVFPTQNYTEEELTSATNDAIREHLREIFKNYEEDINTVIQYNIFLNLHLNAEYDAKSRKFSFISKHGHGFILDFTHENSANTEFGFSKKLYVSSDSDYTHRQNISSSDSTSSLNFTELRTIASSSSSLTELFLTQLFHTNFYKTPPSSTLEYSFFNDDVLKETTYTYVNEYPFERENTGTISDTLMSYVYVKITKKKDPIILFKKSDYNIFISALNVIPNIDWYSVAEKYMLDFNDKSFVEHVEYKVKSQLIMSDNIINLSGERYVDLVCPEIQKELKRYNAGYNKLNRYYFDDISDLYVTSSKGNIADLVLKNPREFGPISRLSRLSFRFLRSDGFVYDFKNIPFFMTISIKYLKPVLHTERRDAESRYKIESKNT
jgi:hypothetical protein